MLYPSRTADMYAPFRFSTLLLFVFIALTQVAWGYGGYPSDTARRVPSFKTPKGLPYRPSRTLTNDLLHTELHIRFDWLRQQAIGKATVSFTPYFYPQNTLILDAKGFEIKAVYQKAAGSTEANRPLTYTYDRRQLVIALPKTYTRLDTAEVTIEYIAKPNELPQGLYGGNPGDKGLFFINADGLEEGKPKQIWTQGETEANSCWFPTVDSPNEKITHDFYITVDNAYTTLSNGVLVGSVQNEGGTRTDHWRQALPHAPYLAMLAVGEFYVEREILPSGLELSYYVEPEYAPYVNAIFGRTPEMVAFFSNIFGVEYPWAKYAQIAVRDFVAGGMENTTATTLTETVQADAKTLVDGNSDLLLAHELAHQWFGDYVTAEEWGQLPLNESFANYAEYLWLENFKGSDEADFHGMKEQQQYLAEADTKIRPLIRYFYRDREEMFDSHSYAKGGRVMHMLRKQVGDEAFFASLQTYLRTHALGTAEVDQFRIAVEKVTGQDYNWFFDQWFKKAGHPVLDISTRYEAGSEKLFLTIQQKQDTLSSTVYTLPVQVDIWTKGIKNRHSITLSKAEQTFEFSAKSRPDVVLFDAEAALLATLTEQKSTPEWIEQYKVAPTFLHKYEALTKLEGKLADTTVRATFYTAMDDPFWRIRQMAIANFSEYDGEGFALIEQRIRSRARTDAHPQVRAEAIITLASFGDNANDILFKEALSDSSYFVVSAALDAYLRNQPDDAAKVAAEFENSPNGAIVTAVGNFYANQAKPDRYDWYIEKMERMKPSEKYNFLQVFGKYLIKSSANVQRKAIPILENLARNNVASFVRFGAYQVLGLLTDIKGVSAIRKDIRLNETDEKLKEMYSQMGDL